MKETEGSPFPVGGYEPSVTICQVYRKAVSRCVALPRPHPDGAWNLVSSPTCDFPQKERMRREAVREEVVGKWPSAPIKGKGKLATPPLAALGDLSSFGSPPFLSANTLEEYAVIGNSSHSRPQQNGEPSADAAEEGPAHFWGQVGKLG